MSESNTLNRWSKLAGLSTQDTNLLSEGVEESEDLLLEEDEVRKLVRARIRHVMNEQRRKRYDKVDMDDPASYTLHAEFSEDPNYSYGIDMKTGDFFIATSKSGRVNGVRIPQPDGRFKSSWNELYKRFKLSAVEPSGKGREDVDYVKTNASPDALARLEIGMPEAEGPGPKVSAIPAAQWDELGDRYWKLMTDVKIEKDTPEGVRKRPLSRAATTLMAALMNRLPADYFVDHFGYEGIDVPFFTPREPAQAADIDYSVKGQPGQPVNSKGMHDAYPLIARALKDKYDSLASKLADDLMAQAGRLGSGYREALKTEIPQLESPTFDALVRGIVGHMAETNVLENAPSAQQVAQALNKNFRQDLAGYGGGS